MRQLASRRSGAVGRLGATAAVFVLGLALLLDPGRPRTAIAGAAPPAAYPTSCAAASAVRASIEQRVLPFWLQTVDRAHGGYTVSDPAAGPPVGTRTLVAQARLLWGFSHAYRAAFGPLSEEYRDAARSGYRYLRSFHYDARHGGYYWSTDGAGHVLDPRKILYGQAFVVYALVEYYRASGDVGALADARQLFRVLDARARDRAYGGWTEHFEADWRPIRDHRYLHVETTGYKSANTHLHMVEALAELASVAPDADLRSALAETFDLNIHRFFPSPAAPVTAFTPDWRSTEESWRPRPMLRWIRDWARGPLVSYGHNVEFAWLARHAEHVLGRPVDDGRLVRFLVHTLDAGVDPESGAVAEFGYGDRPAHARDRVWWPQAELLTALSGALADRPSVRFDTARSRLLAWTATSQTDPLTGIWRERIHPDGRVAPGPHAHAWKLNYHDLRALTAYLASCGVVALR